MNPAISAETCDFAISIRSYNVIKPQEDLFKTTQVFSRITGEKGKEEVFFVTHLYHFHPVTTVATRLIRVLSSTRRL